MGYAILKVPYISSDPNSNVARGYAYSYTDAKTPMTLQNAALDENSGPLYNTLQQIYNNHKAADELAWFYYNDEDPTGHTHNSYGHNKGVAAFDDKLGFWLIHSTPR